MVFDDFTAADFYEAMRARDPRFDGRFFVGVRTTRIYCRPICRVRLPKSTNCSFHRNAAAAEAAGFRPCLRCRPELAPGVVASGGDLRLAAMAALVIECGPADHADFAAAARELGVDRDDFRRIFNQAFGVSAAQFVQTQRLLLAKRLLTDTRLPAPIVAASSGFSSVRCMTAAFDASYRFSPDRLRPRDQSRNDDEVAQVKGGAGALTLVLPYRPPYDFCGLLRFLRDRSIPGVEAVDEGVYRRVLRIGRGENLKKWGWLEVTHQPARHALELRCDEGFASDLRWVLSRTRQAFDLDADPVEIDQVLGTLATNTPGVRLPGTFDPFELATRVILGQQVTVRAARTLATRFVAAFGTPISSPFAELNRVFPSVEDVAGLDSSAIASLGIVRQRAEAIISLANAMSSGGIGLHVTAEPAGTIEQLCRIRGIGPWTAHYIAMRALAWRDAWLPRDIALQNALGLPNTAQGWRAAQERANVWQPWRSYAVLHLWRTLASDPRST